MPEFDWDAIEAAARETGQPVYLGKSGEFTTTQKRNMSRESRKRKMCISMGNHRRNSKESDDDLYVMKKL